MPIRNGEAWGSPSIVEDSWPVVDSDAGMNAHAGFPVRLSGGNLHAALGSPVPAVAGSACMLLPIDALECTVVNNAGVRVMVAHSDVRVGSWFDRRGLVILSNGGIHGGRNVTPRAHPNDGEWDRIDLHARMGMRERWEARRRAVTGTHIPHPCLSVGRFSETNIENALGQRLVIDGIDAGRWTSVTARVLVDHTTVCV